MREYLLYMPYTYRVKILHENNNNWEKILSSQSSTKWTAIFFGNSVEFYQKMCPMNFVMEMTRYQGKNKIRTEFCGRYAIYSNRQCQTLHSTIFDVYMCFHIRMGVNSITAWYFRSAIWMQATLALTLNHLNWFNFNYFMLITCEFISLVPFNSTFIYSYFPFCCDSLFNWNRQK